MSTRCGISSTRIKKQRNLLRSGHFPVTICLQALAGVLLASAVTGPAALAATPSEQADGVLCSAPEHREFDFWIGSWDVLNRNRPPEGDSFYLTGRATDRVYAVVGGCGIVEHWRGMAISRFILGFSIRAWDPATREWLLVLLWPTTGEPSFGELRGGFRHGRGEFLFERHGPGDERVLNRFTFSDITANSLRWENATSRDGGQSWSGSWIMDFTRRDPVAAGGLWNGPTMTTRRCPGEEHRRFDFLLGEWTAERTDAEGREQAVTVELVRILGGCAVMERVRSSDGSWRAFRIRSFEPDLGHWVEYGLDSERRVLVRREAKPGDELVFRDIQDTGGAFTRTRWKLDRAGAVGWIVERSDGPEGDWNRLAEVKLREPVGAPIQP